MTDGIVEFPGGIKIRPEWVEGIESIESEAQAGRILRDGEIGEHSVLLIRLPFDVNEAARRLGGRWAEHGKRTLWRRHG